MKVVILNDTSGTSNPGCAGTVHGVEQVVESARGEVISRMLLGYGYDSFAPKVSVDQRGKVERAAGRLRRAWDVLICGSAGHRPPQKPSDEDLARSWNDAVDRQAEHLAPCWQDVDAVVVNGEGTMHHDAIGARALIGLAMAGKNLGKRVYLVNVSVYALSPYLLQGIKEACAQVAVREPVSLRYLKRHGIDARQSADALFASLDSFEGEQTPKLSADRSYAVYTPGVLSSGKRISEERVGEDVRALRASGREVLYYVVEVEDEYYAKAASEAGAKVLPLGSFGWREVPGLMRLADLVVSGRYHLNIFAAASGVPLIPLESNTPKNVGLMELFGRGEVPVRSWSDTDPKTGALDVEAAVRISPEAVQHCTELAKEALQID